MQPQELDAKLRDYQRALWRPTMFILLAYLALTAPPFLTYLVVAQRWNSPVVPWAFIILVLLLSRVGFLAFRRSVVRLSGEHGLVCPSCQTPLGLTYATTKRTGACGKCKASICGDA